jgi:putative endonuclease
MNVRGQAAEQAAERFLTSQGLHILARNWHCRFGEIDLIAQDGDDIVFVEVRQRRSGRFGGAAASITAAKQKKLVAAARCYLAGLSITPPCRFDAVLFEGDAAPVWLQNILEG